MKRAISTILSVFLCLFIASGFVSAVDDSLQLICGISFLALPRAILSLIAFLLALLVYALMALTPMIPKRVFVPVALFPLVSVLLSLPAMIYGGGDWVRRSVEADWAISLCQVAVGLAAFCWVRGGWKFGWPVVDDKNLGDRPFSWLNLGGFVLANIFVLLPAVAVYLAVCVALAVSHFTAGFFTLRASGVTAHVRQYTRSDGKTIELVPMMHIADAEFYRKISQSFPTDSIVLMEGVTDEKHLLTNGISYKRAAHSLGLAEQVKTFKPRGQMVRADMDVDQFSTNTINLLNMVMLLYTKPVTAASIAALAAYSPPPGVEKQLFDDILRKRNRHLLEKLKQELPQSNMLIVPWGAGHMPAIAKAIQKQGFHLVNTKEYLVIPFR
ncbi:MAG: hypothetical protein ACREE6_06630 [Limisphaerales bacterium]